MEKDFISSKSNQEVKKKHSNDDQKNPRIIYFLFHILFHNSMSQLRPQNSLSNQHEEDHISDNQFDEESLSDPNKAPQRQQGRPRGRGRPKVNTRAINKKKSSQEQVIAEQPKPKERTNINKQENQIEPYVKIVDYLKKIDCDETSFQNKMNPYHSLTVACFWYMVNAEYYSYDFFLKNNPQEAANHILNRVAKLPIQMPTRFIKNTRQGNMLEFQTDEVKKQSDEITQYLNHLIASPLTGNKSENLQKKLSLSTVTQDNEFVSSTRAILFNYIKNKIQKNQKSTFSLKSRLQLINNLQPKQITRRPPLPFEETKGQIIDASQLDILSRQVKKRKSQKKKDQKVSQPLIQHISPSQNMENDNSQNIKSLNQNQNVNMDLENNQVDEQEKIKIDQADNDQIQEQKNQIDSQKSSAESDKICLKPMTSDQVLLSSIINLPLDKVISMLESTIPKVKLPAIYPPFMPIPRSDPLQFVFQLHEDQQKYLEYMKQYKKKVYQSKVRKSQVIIQEEQRQIQFEDAKCQICTDGDYTDDNLIVFCSTCNISLHQRCVGLAKVPAESWVCDVCLAFGPAGINLPCPLCNVKGGAMKRTNIHIDSNIWKQSNPGYYEYAKKCPYNKQKQEYPHLHPHKVLHQNNQNHENNENVENQQNNENHQNESKQEKQQLFYDYFNKTTYPQDQPVCHYVWVHYVCSIWVPECYFQQKNGAINVKGIQNIEKKRYKHQCFVCKKTKAGACVKCQDQQCKKYYHPECARKKKVYMEQLNLQKIKYLVFCEEHEPLKITRQIQYKKKKNRDEIIKFARMIEKYIETYKIAIFPFKLMKIIPTKSFIQTFQAEGKEEIQEQKPEIIRQSDEQFIKQIIIKLSKLKKISVTVQKTATGLKIVDVYQPSRRQMRKSLNKYDDFWHTIQNGQNAEENYKRYDIIVKENLFLKDKMETFLNGGSLAGSAKLLGKNSQKNKKGKARGKNAKQQGQTLIQQEGGIFCICRKPYENQLDMIECQICGEWYHYKCIGFVGTEVDAQTLQFHCMKCMKFQSEEQKRPRLQKCIHLFSNDSLYLNYSPPTPKLMSEEDPEQVKQVIKLDQQNQRSSSNEDPQINRNNNDNKVQKTQLNGIREQIQQNNKEQATPEIAAKTTKLQKQQNNLKQIQNAKPNQITNIKNNGPSLTKAPSKQEQKSLQSTITQFLGSKLKKEKQQIKKNHTLNNHLSVKQKLADLQRSIREGEYNTDRK